MPLSERYVNILEETKMITKPSISRGWRLPKSGRGGVFSAKMAISPTTNSLFSLTVYFLPRSQKVTCHFNGMEKILLREIQHYLSHDTAITGFHNLRRGGI
jgi:hypothetical protein